MIGLISVLIFILVTFGLYVCMVKKIKEKFESKNKLHWERNIYDSSLNPIIIDDSRINPGEEMDQINPDDNGELIIYLSLNILFIS